MAALILSIVPLAIGAAISPILFGIEILALSAATRPRLRAWLVVLGALSVLLAFGTAGLLVGHALPHRRPHHQLDATIDLLAAGALIGVALHTLRSSRSAAPRPTILDRLQGASTGAYLGAGVLGMLTNVSTLVLFVPALRMITKSTAGGGAQAAAAVVLLGITLLPVIVPALIVTLLGDRANPALSALSRTLSSHSAQITIGIELVFAALLLARGLTTLA